MVDGFVVEVINYPIFPTIIEYELEKTGYVANAGTANEIYNTDPTGLDGFDTNWIATIEPDDTGLFIQSQDDYQLIWVNPTDSTYRSPRFGFTYLRAEIPVFAVNARTGVQAEIFIEDQNSNSEFDAEDLIIIAEPEGFSYKFRHKVSFTVPDGETATAPAPGNRLNISVKREFQTGDYFQFTLRRAYVDTDLAKSELDDIAVVPNPYVGASLLEGRSQITGRGERKLEFINLPQECTIRIYTLRGELVDTIYHDGFGSDGSESWDLRTSGSQDIAFGVYVYHVDAPGIGEHIGKFAVVK
jgi:hypothetical protein